MMIKYCGAALCALICVLLLKSHKSELALLVSLGASILLISAAIDTFGPAFDFVKEIMAKTEVGEYFSVLVKALGVTLGVQFTAELCRDSGESGIASKLELVGKAEILILCLPLIRELVALTADIMNT